MAPSDAPESVPETTTLDTRRSASPSLPSPNTNATGEARLPDANIPQKREREVSLEPATPRADDLDSDPERPKPGDRDLRTPAKKNRTKLGVTQEEEGEDDAPVSGSPPHETKMRQISQGVEDINWKNKQNANKDAADRPSTPLSAPAAPAAAHRAGVETPIEHADAGASPPTVSHSVSVPPSPQPSVMDVCVDGEPHVESAPTKTSKSSSRRSSESEDESERNRKRKLADRAASQGPVEEPAKAPKETKTRRESAELSTAKRPRDDADEDDNPRETKRPSPPPDKPNASASKPEAAAEETKSAPAPASGGGFLAYASSSSPFASVKGPNLFASGKSASTSTAPAPWPSADRASPGPNSSVFGGGFTSSSPPTAGSASPFASARFSPAPPAKAHTPPPAQTPAKRSGFEAFAAAASPFASAAARPKSPGLARSKSPVRRGAPAAAAGVFSAYAAGGAQGFAVPVAKRARAGSPGDALGLFGERRSESAGAGAEEAAGGSGSGSGRDSKAGSRSREGSEESGGDGEKEEKTATFGERLRAGRNGEAAANGQESVWGERKVELTEQEVFTGEEDEETVHHVRGKLFVLSEQNQWRERGTGTIRLNVRQTDGGRARLVMRKDAVYSVLLNVTLFRGMSCFVAQDPRYLRFSVIEDGVTTHYNLRVASAKAAAELLADIKANIPGSTPEEP